MVQLKFSLRSSLASFGFRVGPHLVHMCSRHGSDVAQTLFLLDSGSVQLWCRFGSLWVRLGSSLVRCWFTLYHNWFRCGSELRGWFRSSGVAKLSSLLVHIWFVFGSDVVQVTKFDSNLHYLAVLRAKLKIKNPRIRAGIGPKPTIPLGKWQSGPSPGTPPGQGEN